VIPGDDSRSLDAAQAASERLDHRRDFRLEAARHDVQVDGRDPLGHDEPLRIGTGEKHQLATLLATRAAVTRTARRGVRGNDAVAVDDPTKLVPERRW